MQPEASSALQTPTDGHLASPKPPQRTEAEPQFRFTVKPREPPTFSGDGGQDVIVWLGIVNDFLELTRLPKQQAVAYII